MTMEKRLTPMMELFKKFGHLLPNIEKEFLEKERRELEEAWLDGLSKTPTQKKVAEMYYQKTFKTE